MSRMFEKGVFVIGEVAQAHDGSLGTAHAYIDVLADAGADAVKFQTHYAQYESTLQEPWRVKFSYQDDSRYDYWRRMEFTEEQWSGLKEHAEQRGLVFMSSPFSIQAAEMLDRLGMRVWKVASGEVSDPWLLEFILKTGKPIIFSTGMSSYQKIEDYLKTIPRETELAIMQCTTKYPSPPEDVGLNCMLDMMKRYGVPVGLSDHSGDIFAPLAAVSLGARVIETHICMNKMDFGPDVKASLTPDQFQQMVTGIRQITTMLETKVDKDALAEQLCRSSTIFSKSVYAARDIEPGEIFTKENLALKKPCYGIPAREVNAVLGKVAQKTYQKDELITLENMGAMK